MRIVIMGCGRVGAQLGTMLSTDGHDVTIMDINPGAFNRLPADFQGRRVVGNGIDQDALTRAGVEGADAFVAVTQGDNRNIMSAQIAKQIFKVPRVVCRIYDPIREEIYHTLGLRTISPTSVGAELFRQAVGGEPNEDFRLDLRVIFGESDKQSDAATTLS
jgi:trk system potassium uptake protein